MSNTRTAQTLLKVVFVLAPILAGLDKFAHVLTNWEKYACPMAQSILGSQLHHFFLLAGVIEVIVGILVAVPSTTRIGAYIAGVWLLLITANLVACGHLYLDIALRDFGLALSAFALAKLTEAIGGSSQAG